MEQKYEDYFKRWLSGLDEEIEHWKIYMEEKGNVRFYEFEETVSNHKQFQMEKDIPIEAYNTVYQFLDVASGPFLRCGQITDKVKLDVLSIDPLADVYHVLKEENGIDVGIKQEAGFVELLSRKFSQNTFDMVHMCNALDECFDAVYAIYQLLYVCKTGGKVILRQPEKWDISLHNEDNTFLIWKNAKKYNIPNLLEEYADIELYPDMAEGDWKYNKIVLKKKKDIVLPQAEYYDKMFQSAFQYLFSRMLREVEKWNRKPMTDNELACKKIVEIYDAPEKFIGKIQSEKIETVDIYGMGEVGCALYLLLEKCGLSVGQVIDRERKTFHGKTTIPIEAYEPDKEVSRVIVTIYNGRALVVDLLLAKVPRNAITDIDGFLDVDAEETKQEQKEQGMSVEFYLVDAFEISHFEPIYHFFMKKGAAPVFVAEPCERNTSGNWFDYDSAVEQLKQKKLRYKTECDPQAQIAFSTQENRILKKYWSLTKKVSLCYGTAFVKNCFSTDIRTMDGFDYKLVHGIYDKKICEEKAPGVKVRVIGCPRHYGLRRDSFHTEEIRNELGIKTEKKIILYMPTWDEHASIQVYREAFFGLRKSYYIVTKPHHCTYRLRSKREDLKILYEISDMVLDAAYSLEKSAFIGDITIVDAKSGAAFESCFINPESKMIWLSPQKDIRNYFVEDVFTMAEITNEPEKLDEIVLQTFDCDRYQKVRKEQIFDFLADESEQCMDKLFEEIKKDCAEG